MATEKQQLRVALIGPVLPFRGGIAQHTTMLARALSHISNLKVYSYYRQYPQWLFPGETDRDPAHEGHNEQNTSYFMDSLNPLSWHRLVNEIRKFKPDTVIVPWWTVFWAPSYWYISNKLRKYGLPVTFFCHNVIEHEASNWKAFLTRQVLKLAKNYIVHTQQDRDNLLSVFPAAIVRVHPHPIYDHFPAPSGKLPRRKGLELLFYGFVRPYKGLDDLVEAFRKLQGKDIQLTIAGEFWGSINEIRKKISLYGLDDQIELRPRYHNDTETAELFNRADLVVLPYRTATGSGVIPIAYHYNKPVIATSVGGLPEVVEEGETGWIVPPRAPEELAKRFMKVTRNQCMKMGESISDYKKNFSWESLAVTILEKNE